MYGVVNPLAYVVGDVRYGVFMIINVRNLTTTVEKITMVPFAGEEEQIC